MRPHFRTLRGDSPTLRKRYGVTHGEATTFEDGKVLGLRLEEHGPPSADDLRYQRAGHVREPHVAATESVRQLLMVHAQQV